MTLSRVLAVAAAACLVFAFALATLLPPQLSLGAEMLQLDGGSLARLHGAVAAHLSELSWQRGAVPFLVRPLWMVPAMIGVVLAGLALTLASKRAPGTRRRRS